MKGGEIMLMSEWWKKYTSGEIRKDYDGNYGVQCVDTANSFAEHVLGFGKGVFYGVRYAKEIFDNHNKKLFIAEKNELHNYPDKGNLVIWNRGVAGHIAIVVEADEHNITVLESNYDGKGSTRQHTYTNYNNVVGWLIPYKTVNVYKGTGLFGLYHRFKDINKLYNANICRTFINGEKLRISGTDDEFTQVRGLDFGNKKYTQINMYVISKFLK